jgi:hypothetical protein
MSGQPAHWHHRMAGWIWGSSNLTDSQRRLASLSPFNGPARWLTNCQTITVTVDDTDLHLVSYYTQNDILSGRLDKPNSRPDIMGLDLPPEIFRLSNLRDPPKVKIGPDGRPQLV